MRKVFERQHIRVVARRHRAHAQEFQVALVVLIDEAVRRLALWIGDAQEQMVRARVGEALRVGVGRRLADREVVPVRRAGDGRTRGRGQVAWAAVNTARAVILIRDHASREVRDRGDKLPGVGDGDGAVERVKHPVQASYVVILEAQRVAVAVLDAGDFPRLRRAVEGMEQPLARVGEREREGVVAEAAFVEELVARIDAVRAREVNIAPTGAVIHSDASSILLDEEIVGMIPVVAHRRGPARARAIGAHPGEVEADAGDCEVFHRGDHFA